jgi:pimeloyl-ACP methyl ester carboxylesterase
VTLGREDHGEGEPLVLLHGVAASRAIWRQVSAALSTRRRVVVVDVPGFGQTAPAGAGFALEEVADRLVEGLQLDAFDLVGHSLGGAVAVVAAARHPDSVRRLVLVSPAGLAPRAEGLAAALGVAAELAVHARRALGYDHVDRPGARWLMFGTTVADPGRLSPEDARMLLEASDGAVRIADGVRQALAADLRAELAAAPMPVGLIWGEADRVVPYAGLGALRELRPDAAVETLPGIGHIPQIEDPPGFVAALERILSADA